MATERDAKSAGASTTSAMTHRWPRCTPSKLPMVATEGPKFAGNLREVAVDLHQAISKVSLQAVVGETDVRWQDGFGGGVVEVVAHVGEEGAARLELFDEGDGFFEVRVAGVRLAAQRVEDEDVEVLEQRNALVGDVAHVGEVGGGAEAVAGDLLAAVGDGDAPEAGAEEIDARAGRGVDAVNLDAGAGGVAVFLAEGVVEDALDVAGGGVVGVDGQVALGVEAERAEVVEAEDVVGVAVGVEDGVDAADVLRGRPARGSRGRCR